MYNIIRIHSPAIAHQNNAVEISTLSTIPSFLRNAVSLENHQLILDNRKGFMIAPLGSVIGYESSDETDSGFNCWPIGQLGVDIVNIDGTYYTKPHIIHAMLIPAKDEAKPVWAHSCNLIYNDDGTVTLNTDGITVSGRIGIDFLLCHGMKKNGSADASILSTTDESYTEYIVCDSERKDLGKLSELYPA